MFKIGDTMLKKISIRKIILSSLALFAMLLIYIIPSNEKDLDIKEELEYVNTDIESTPIFLMDQNSYVALTNVALNETSIINKAKELIKVLTIGKMDSKVPSGFSAIIPANTEVLSIGYENGIIKVDFSKDLLNISEKLEEKMIEAIAYTLTSIDKVNGVIIYVEGDILTKLPKTKINLPSTLDKTFGINKEFDLTSTKDIKDVTIYYINQISENYYYVPVTKYINDDRDKIDIIIDELSNNFDFNKNLMSFLNNGTKLVSSNIEDDTMILNFSKDILTDSISYKISEETLDMITLSIGANYDVKSVVLNVEDKKLYSIALR